MTRMFLAVGETLTPNRHKCQQTVSNMHYE